jgi:uncharacterized repeat protein (TIGR02543 family)
MKRFSIFSITVVLIVGLVGCAPAPTQYNLTISSTEGGSVTTPGEGTVTYDEVTVVNLVVEAEEGYVFDGWVGDVGTIADDKNPTTTIIMNDDYIITANFREIPEPTTVTIGFYNSWPTAYPHGVLLPAYFEMVEEETGGAYELEIEWYPNETLPDPRGDVYEGVVQGTIDAGCSSNVYTPDRFPVMLTLSQAGVAPPTNTQAGSMTTWEFYKEYPDEYDDVKLLYLFNKPPSWLHSISKVDELADVQGMDIRARGPGITAIGATPIDAPTGNVVASVQAGDYVGYIDLAGMLVIESAYEVFGYSLFVPFLSYYGGFAVVMNWDVWNELPSDLQAAFDAVAEDAVKQAGQIWQYYEDQYIGQCEADYDHEFLQLDPAEEAEWIALLEPIADDYAAQLDALGYDGSAIIAKARELAEKNNGITWPEWAP